MSNLVKLVLAMVTAFVWGAVAWTFTENTTVVMAGAVVIGFITNQGPKPPRRRKQRKLVLQPIGVRSWNG